jgi:hypothetical protein
MQNENFNEKPYSSRHHAVTAHYTLTGMCTCQGAQYNVITLPGSPVLQGGELHSAEADLLPRSGSVAEPLEMDLLTIPGNPSPIKGQGPIKFTSETPPLRREDGAGRPPGLAGTTVTETLNPSPILNFAFCILR